MKRYRIEKQRGKDWYYPCWWDLVREEWQRFKQNERYVCFNTMQEAEDWLADAKSSDNYIAYLHEALEQCERMELGEQWRKVKALLEREQRRLIAERSQSIR